MASRGSGSRVFSQSTDVLASPAAEREIVTPTARWNGLLVVERRCDIG
jgi:hypothetical protein